MNDSTSTIKSLMAHINKVMDDREWGQFHNAKNLSMDIAIEAGELMEHFVWLNTAEEIDKTMTGEKREAIKHEIADVAIILVRLCSYYNIDLSSIILIKLKEIEAKYPIEKAKGKNLKYNEL